MTSYRTHVLGLVLGALLGACSEPRGHGSDAGLPPPADGQVAVDGSIADASTPPVDADAEVSALDLALRARLAMSPMSGDPTAGHATLEVDAPLARLGQQLFFSRSLSRDLDVACASCHHPSLAGADGLSLPVGVGAADPSRVGLGRFLSPASDDDPRSDSGPNVARNAPTTFNAALYDTRLYADGRIYVTDAIAPPGGAGAHIRTPDSRLGIPDPEAGPDLLAAAVRFEVVSAPQMAGHQDDRTRAEHRAYIAARLRGETPESATFPRNLWLERFREGFAEPTADAATLITFDRIAEAISAYLRSQIFVDHAFSRYLAGQSAALSDAQKRGALAFYTPTAEGGAGCASCHAGDTFTDERFHAVGFPQMGRGFEVSRADYGRGALTGGGDSGRYAFRTPSLLNVGLTSPYGHAGTFDTLEAVVDFHVDPSAPTAEGFDGAALTQLAGTGFRYPWATELSTDVLAYVSPAARAPGLAPETRADLVAFLHALTDPCAADPSCIAPFVPDASVDPDGQQLQAAIFTPFGPAPLDPGARPWPGDPGSATAAPSSVGIDLRALACGTRQQQGAASSSFVDRSVEVGFTHAHRFATSRYTSIESADLLLAAAGVSAGDLDGDCHPDLVFASGDEAGLVFYRNLGGDGFARVSPSLELPRSALVSGVALVDLDGDRRTELVVGELGPGAIRVLEGDLVQGYTQVNAVPSARSSFGIAAGDLDGDGDPDLAVAHWDTRFPREASPLLLRNEGGLSLLPDDARWGVADLPGAHRYGFSPALVDMDLDGAVDLAIAADFGNSFFGLQRAGTLVDATDRSVITDANGMGMALGDFDADLDLDWFVTAIDWEYTGGSGPAPRLGNRLYRNDGAGVFADVTDQAGVRHGEFGWGACAGDFDNDGDLDLFHVNGWANLPAGALAPAGNLPAANYAAALPFVATAPRLFENRGDGTFVDDTSAWGLDDVRQGRGVSCGDFDRDGDVDLVVAVNSGAPRYLENQRGAGLVRRFVGVRLEGPAANTDALGARVYVTAAGRTQLRVAALYSHHLSHDPLDLHFGLGAAFYVEELRVVWPDGAPDTVLRNLPVNRFVTVRHPTLDPMLGLDPTRRARAEAIAIGARAAIDRGDAEDSALTILGSLARWYGLLPSVDALAELFVRLADAIDAGLPSLASRLRVLARYLLAVPIATEADLAMQAGSSALVHRAHHCGAIPLPPWFEASLAADAEAGGVASLDALEAFAAASSQGCGSLLGRDALARLVDRVVALVDLDDGVLDRDELRALALLAHLGREDRLSRPLLEAVIDAAQPDAVYGAQQPLDGSVVPMDDRSTAFAAWLFATLGRHARVLEPLVP